MTILTTALGLVGFAAALERYLIRRATWLETVLLVLGSAAMFWPAVTISGVYLSTWTLDVVGLACFAVAVFLQIVYKPANLKPLPVEAGHGAA